MKMLWKEILVCAIMGIILPGTMFTMKSGIPQLGQLQAEVTVETTEETTEETTGETQEALAENPEIPVLWIDGALRPMDMEEYLVGVVLAEMPASFEEEALKAQAVAARTYAGKAHLTGGKHGNGSVCTDATCCQAYISEAGYLQSGGSQQGIDKVRSAVMETAGQVLTHNGELIEATYFSCSGGTTEDAQAVWGADFPYLRSVSSPGEEASEFYETDMVFPRERVETTLGVKLPENPAKWVGETKRTPGDGVATMEIGGQVFKGTELRTLLGLRSTSFTAAADDRGLIVHVKGYGHRVGMSQYGADAMAASGKTYREILSHYYQGTEIAAYEPPAEEKLTEVSQPPVA